MDYLIVVAGGQGRRMGGEVPKQFRLLGGRPVLMHTLSRLRRCRPSARLILVLPADHLDDWRQLCDRYDYSLPHEIAVGGETRFASVASGLRLIPDDAVGAVGVHDGVRPFVTPELVSRLFDQVAEKRALIPAVTPVETVRLRKADGSTRLYPRDDCYLVQTPQVFDLQLLKRAYRQPYCERFTDDASVVEQMGQPIHLVEGSRDNIKLTTPRDMELAEVLLRRYGD
ncbi:MAG: 2-C-methyl-D-erythritol 4-phosphate cytidylyltransferase [Prevotellaceae bacterium]|jgi:2-C-methyl-D-erythritol 4-phosphate cytidylyltransferase|nr:2-C-methyl-D-erythritol 4-phosphate cytidylyltransferase [Prevotellaceae bacterium]MDY3855825.1 2-C-methyl-D-erythritol 4-phosphate cytidylyltransferase [Bacteroidaceae bacterium]